METESGRRQRDKDRRGKVNAGQIPYTPEGKRFLQCNLAH